MVEQNSTVAKILRYGMEFPDYVSDLDIELWCYSNNHTQEKGGLGASEHLKNAIKLLFPEKTKKGQPLFVWHEWTDIRCDEWCANEFETWWGPAASAKSTDAAVIALTDWYADPINTTTIICSTTLPMLKRRIFGEMVKYHQIYKDVAPGKYMRSRTAIVLDPDKMDTELEKAGIFGFAVQQGSREEAKNNIIGQHNRRVRLLIDEAQHPALEVAFEAIANLEKGCDDFKVVAFGNPSSRLDPLGRHSEPIGGWDTINPDMDSWPTKEGKCIFFDGKNSPGMRDPKKYSFLVKQKDFDKTEFDTPDYWQFCRGYIRPEGSTLQIISESFAIKHKMQAKPEWVSDYRMGAGFDPSYSTGGDKRVIVPFQAGLSTWGAIIISFLEPYEIFIEVSKLEEKTFARQLAEKAIEYCRSLGVEKRHFGMDTTGAQTILADFIDEVWEGNGRIYRCEFGGKASDLQASEENKLPAHDVYANRVTELWFNMVAFARSNQIRNLPLVALKQFTIRELLDTHQKRMRTNKRQIEPKRLMKERTGGRSPDDADACCIALDVARQRMNIHPGMANLSKRNRESDEQAVELDVDAGDLYLTDGIPT